MGEIKALVDRTAVIGGAGPAAESGAQGPFSSHQQPSRVSQDRRPADLCKTSGAVGALLRREGLYSWNLTTWRAAPERGDLVGPTTVKKRGPVPRVPDPRDKRITEVTAGLTVQRASLADGDRDTHLGHVRDRHLEALV